MFFIIIVYYCQFYFKDALIQNRKSVDIFVFTYAIGFKLQQFSVFEICAILISELFVLKNTETKAYVLKQST